MALIRCYFKSDILQLNTSMTVILPEVSTSGSKTNYPTLYLLHGLSDDDTIWMRKTSIERYVEHLNLAVIMPQVHRSFYTDMVHGNKYWTFLTEELPKASRAFFPLSNRREDTFVAGLSMGGYGALKWALSKPGEICAAASLSGAVDVAAMMEHEHSMSDDFSNVFGNESVQNTKHDLFSLLHRMTSGAGPTPRIFQCCGTEDFLYDDNQKFRTACENSRLDYHYQESPGNHDWAYWDMQIQSVIDWIQQHG
ncbi:alpha/beta hydrolase family protein [Alicyclobacillus sp. SO9]|uniref:alpha/beta hydrolase n=1 Tax=Alicyclobacillus sp. SO9 TaxID=2665646 RepID=UPI0018E8AA6E|nr:alpha/beta hydrolase family protein [Alicyclobacillus sp. SO9]QQE79914.1 esterase family protein [Alicyclobacillus sp. SO9]